MSNKQVYVANRMNWKEEYGTFMHNLGNVTRNLIYIHNFMRLDEKPLRIIDYGCAYGYYLRVLKMINPKHDLYGVDIAKEAAEASMKVVGKGRVFWQSCGEPLPLEDDSVDLIYSFDMIEHAKDKNELIGFFKECNRLIKKNGLILIATPNCNWFMKIVYKLMGKEWIYNPRLGEHPHPFTEEKFLKFVKPMVQLVSVRYDLDTFLPRKLAGLFPAYSILYKTLSKLKISLDMMFVMRKKPKSRDTQIFSA